MQYYPYGPHHGGYGGWGYGWIYGIIGLVIFLAILYFLFRNAETQKRDDRPLEILKERYAKGEISREEFEEARKELEK
jgi:putative membrane protein